MAAGRRSRVVFFVDEGVVRQMPDLPKRMAAYVPHNADRIELAGPVEIVEGGEQAKNDPELVERLQRLLVSRGVDRHSYVVAIGGGAVLDLIGYVAATTHRGIRHIRIPTTVLAQNDSGVGVKNGVNAFGIKNLLGTFVPPIAVINDSRLHRRASRSRQARRHGRGGQGRAHPRRRLLRLARGEGRSARAVHLGAARPSDPPLRAAAHAPDRPRRRSVRARQRRDRSISATGRRTSSRRCRTTSCATARPSPSASRSTRAIRCLPGCCRRARICGCARCSSGLASRLWHETCDARGADRPAAAARGPRGVPRAPRRRAHHHASQRHRHRRRGARDGS